MANVPDQPVARRIEEVVQCYSQFDNAEARSEMAARYCHRVDCLGTQFVCDLAQLLFVEPAKIGRLLDAIEKQAGHDPNNILATPRFPEGPRFLGCQAIRHCLVEGPTSIPALRIAAQ